MSLELIRNLLHTTHKGCMLISGSFRFDTASNPSTVLGDVSSVTHDATGIWTVTFKTALKSRGIVAMVASLEMDANAALSFVQLGAASASAGTQIVRAFTEGGGTIAAADIAAGANRGNWCHLIGLAKYTTAPDGSGIT